MKNTEMTNATEPELAKRPSIRCKFLYFVMVVPRGCEGSRPCLRIRRLVDSPHAQNWLRSRQKGCRR